VNNRQLHYDEKQLIKQQAAGDTSKEARLTQAACYAVQCWAQYPEGSQLYNANFVSESDAQSLKTELGWVQSMQSQGEFVYSGFDKATDRIAAVTGISNDAIGGKPTGDWNKPFTDAGNCVTAECAAGLTPDRPLSQADIDAKRNGAADFAGYVSEQAGRFSTYATAYGTYLLSSPNLFLKSGASVQFGLAGAGTIAELVASGVEQILRPNLGKTFVNGSVDIFTGTLGNKFPLLSPGFNEFGENVKNTPPAKSIEDTINNGGK
jgi:filamentous hemagglutinin